MAVPLPGPFPLLTQTFCQGTWPRRQMLRSRGRLPGIGASGASCASGEAATLLAPHTSFLWEASFGRAAPPSSSQDPSLPPRAPQGHATAGTPGPAPRAPGGQSHSSRETYARPRSYNPSQLTSNSEGKSDPVACCSKEGKLPVLERLKSAGLLITNKNKR